MLHTFGRSPDYGAKSAKLYAHQVLESFEQVHGHEFGDIAKQIMELTRDEVKASGASTASGRKASAASTASGSNGRGRTSSGKPPAKVTVRGIDNFFRKGFKYFKEQQPHILSAASNAAPASSTELAVAHTTSNEMVVAQVGNGTYGGRRAQKNQNSLANLVRNGNECCNVHNMLREHWNSASSARKQLEAEEAKTRRETAETRALVSPELANPNLWPSPPPQLD
jgi:hypothetical protein